MTYRAVRLRKRSCRRGLAMGLPLAERLGESIERKAGPFVGQGIRAPYKEDWAVRVVFEGEEVYSSLAKDFTNFLNRELVKHPFLRRDIVPRQHVCSLVYFARHNVSPSASADCSGPTQEGRSPACRVASRRGRPGDYVWHHGPAVWAY